LVPDAKILIGDVRAMLRSLPARSVQCVITSPPYWALRDYGTEPQVWGGKRKCQHVWGPTMPGRKRDNQHVDQAPGARGGGLKASAVDHSAPSAGQFCQHCRAWLGELGQEPTPSLHVRHQVEVFREIWRVLKDDGTVWMNFGDSYVGSWGAQSRDYSGIGVSATSARQVQAAQRKRSGTGTVRERGLKPKDLVGMPWRVAFALQADGWYLRQDIIWAKPCPMPESVRDRCTKAHEYIFLLTKRAEYYYDADAIKEPVTGGSHPRGNGVNPKAAGTGVGWGYADDEKPRTKYPSGWDGTLGTSHKAIDHNRPNAPRSKQNASFSGAVTGLVDTRNKRSVWTIPPEPYPDAHYATFPSGLVRPCILAGTRPGDLVLDPFGGSGTVGAVALEYGRNAILIDINPTNERLMRARMAEHTGQAILQF
jgi:site-specific DNA-methyltransferase (cytosine-N4-specific)